MNNNTQNSEWIIRGLTIGLLLFVFTELNNNNYSESGNTIAITSIYQLDNNAIAITPSILPHVIGHSQLTDNSHLQLKTYSNIALANNLTKTKFDLQLHKYLNIKPIMFSIQYYNTNNNSPKELPVIA